MYAVYVSENGFDCECIKRSCSEKVGLIVNVSH